MAIVMRNYFNKILVVTTPTFTLKFLMLLNFIFDDGVIAEKICFIKNS